MFHRHFDWVTVKNKKKNTKSFIFGKKKYTFKSEILNVVGLEKLFDLSWWFHGHLLSSFPDSHLSLLPFSLANPFLCIFVALPIRILYV